MTGGAGVRLLAPCQHVVQFYGDGQEMLDRSVPHLDEALSRGGSVVVVATPDHRRDLIAALDRRGIDVPAGRRAERIVELDAEATLEAVMADGAAEAGAFDAVVGETVVRSVQRATPLHVFGEMVDLLWDRGEPEAAIGLERRWNDLRSRVSFSLLCAYRTGDGTGDHRHDARFADVCGLHSGLIGAPPGARPWPGAGVRAGRRFTASVRSPRAARHFVVQTLGDWRLAGLADDAAVVVTEMSTNAVVHAGSPFRVTVGLDHAALRISVSDTSRAAPVSRAAPRLATRGRGLHLVEELSERWGSQAGPGGKVVWAELALDA